MSGRGGSNPVPEPVGEDFWWSHPGPAEHRRDSLVPEQRLPENVIPLRPDDGWLAPVMPIPLPAQRVHPVTPGRVAGRLAEWPMLLVGLGVVAALALVAFSSLRVGCVVLGAAMTLATVLRLVLGERGCGLLRSRSRLTDLLVMGSLSLAMVALALSVPAPG